MLSEKEAEAAAAALLAAERAKSLEARNARARPVPWYFQVEGLGSLQPFQQELLIRELKQRVPLLPSFLALLGMWIAVLLVFAKHLLSAGPGPLLTLAVVSAAGWSAVRVIFVRMALARELSRRRGA